MKDFSIIIVSWNVCGKLRENLAALGASAGVDIEIIVVDNNSADDTVRMVSQEFPEVKLIANTNNVGFARGCNEGMKVAEGHHLVLLNPDMKVNPSTLADLKGWLDENPQADITGIRLLDNEGRTLPHVRRFPCLSDQLSIVLKLPHVFPHMLDDYLRKDFDYDMAASVDSIRGAFFVIRRSALEKFGYLDERYFLWFEEVDYCRTVKANGGEVWYTPAAECVDYVGASFNQVGRAAKQKYFRDSMISYFKKWEPGWQGSVLLLGWKISEAIVWAAGLLKLKSRTRT